MTPSRIVTEYPHLTLDGIYAALAYYHDHREQLNAEISAERESDEAVMARKVRETSERLNRVEFF